MVSWDQHRVDAHQAKFAPKCEEPDDAVPFESKLHNDIEGELKRRRWYYVHSRMDKRPTNQLGVTDFIVAMPGGRTLWMEVKRKGAKLTKEQNITMHILKSQDHWHEVVFSMSQFLDVISRRYLYDKEKGTNDV